MPPRVTLVRYFPYRKGQIRANEGNHVVEFLIEVMRDFQKLLADLAKTRVDNHTCFIVKMSVPFGEDETKAFMFSDYSMYMGDWVEQKSW